MQIKNLMIRPIVTIVLLMMVTFFCHPILVAAASVVYTEKDIYNQGEMIGVHFTNAPGYDSDWICVVPMGSPDTHAGNYKYMPKGLSEGFLIFDPLPSGEYEVRAYYDYRSNGYVVSGRYAFSVGSDLIEPNFPPPIPFAAPPEMVVIPETYVYVAPDIDVDLFFWGGWWWRPWEGRWYRSHYYDRDWGYYNNVPSFYFDVDPGWRGYYRNRNWYGHRWDYERIPNQRLQQNWKGWQNDRHWERRGTWGVQNYRSQPQKQRQELRQQRQQQYQQRPEVQQHQQQRQRQPQAQQPRQQPQERVQQPRQPEQRPQVQQPRQKPQERVQSPRQPEVQRQEREPEIQQPQRPQVKQPQRPQIQQPRRQPEDQKPPRRPDFQRQQRQPEIQQPQRPQAKQPEYHQQPEGRQSQRQPEEKVRQPQSSQQKKLKRGDVEDRKKDNK